jgi:hypothetical protein
VWSDQPLEDLLKKRLNTLPEPARTDLWPDYAVARRFVLDEIARYIPAAEAALTDHGPDHLADVMRRVHELIGDQSEYFTPPEIYVLNACVLFHDVGNLHGRKEHQKKIATIYDSCRKREPRFATERTAILAIAGAHTGAAKDGSTDTLGELDRLSFQAHPIRGRELAAVLRFADELAEGPHRTSAYMLNHHMYTPDSRIFHKYASVTEYCIERGAGRIAATYNIDLELISGSLEVGHGLLLADLLTFIYKRIAKLDQERRYCKFYCDLLAVFKETGAWFNFYHEGIKIELEIPPIVMSDLIIPGEFDKPIEQISPRYQISELVKALEIACRSSI